MAGNQVRTQRELLLLVPDDLRDRVIALCLQEGEAEAYVLLREEFEQRTGRMIRNQPAMGYVRRVVKAHVQLMDTPIEEPPEINPGSPPAKKLWE